MADSDLPAACSILRLVLGAELVVEAREAPGQRTHRLLGPVAHHQIHGKVLERDGGLRVERLAVGLYRLRDSHGIDNDVMGLGGSGRRDLPEVVRHENAGAAALHLLEVVSGFDVAHEQQAFERLHVGAGGDHVHGDGDARVVIVAKGRQGGLRVLGSVGDLAAELVAFAELLSDGLDDVVGVAVGLGEDQGLGKFPRPGNICGQLSWKARITVRIWSGFTTERSSCGAV